MATAVSAVEDLAAVRRALQELDLRPISYKLTRSREGDVWTEEKAARVEACYRAFLYVAYANPDRRIVPSGEVDDYWHAHILDTRKYAEDCARIFGRFIHHWPYFGIEDDQQEELLAVFEESQELMRDAIAYFAGPDAGRRFFGPFGPFGPLDRPMCITPATDKEP